ncbi:hypothetical protein BZG36_00516 [Bifiguratus adelaidae]|uniref:3-hydroxyisobutyrate dehydrogenase n=1 Tax=Bifiguratus adelaidae TaxID=1938954 RepID=A0A261Y746_9FUNG|nr:hypothetical protein BZG36_00516 [Bifiguratus adelaidae]
MGFHMANNLVAKTDNKIIIHDVFKPSVDRFMSHNREGSSRANAIDIASNPKEVAERAAVVITMLPATPQVESVYMGNNGLVEGVRSDSLVIDCSTVDVLCAKAMASEVVNKGGKAVDAPVSGGIGGAQAGTLTFMVGADSEDTFRLAEPHLQPMARKVWYCGANGNGQVAKICNNMLLGISMIGVCETMQLGVKMGMDSKLLAEIINTSTGRCWSSDTYNPVPGVLPNVPSSNGYQGGFGNTLMAKDLRLATNAANEAKSTVMLGALASQIYNQVSSTEEYAKLDFSSIFKWLQQGSGVPDRKIKD